MLYRKIFPVLLFVFVTGILYSCKKDNNNTPKTEGSSKVETAKSLKAYPGLNRIKLIWEVSDASVKKAVVTTDGLESATIPYDGSEEMEAVIDDLAEGNHSFVVLLYDDKENASPQAKIVTRVYGDHFIQSLASRDVLDAIYIDGTVKIAWGNATGEMTDTEIKYVSTSGDTLFQSVSVDQDSSFLTDYQSGTHFTYRTMNKPVPEAIDSFYAAYTSSQKQSMFANPLFTNKGADPWVAYKDGMYYFTYTQGGGITLFATKKMSQLGVSQPVEVWRPPGGTMYSKDLWAPELHFIDGKWYVYFAADDGTDANHRMYVIENASADPLSGTWEFKGELQEPSNNWAIDGTPLEYNGQLYFIWSGKTNNAPTQILYITKMTNPYTLEGSRIAISTPVYDWEKHGNPINEGPEILKNKDGDVFLIYSGSNFSTDDYCLGMLSLKKGGDPLNPSDWTKRSDPVFTRNDAAGAYGPGHNGFFKSRDGSEDWIIYHARSFPDQGSTNYRNPRIQKFTWNPDGSPNFGKPVNINESMTTPSGEF